MRHTKRCGLTHELAGNTPWPTAWHLRWCDSTDVAGRAIRTCSTCGQRLALGPARDDGPHAAQVAVELRAAELAAAWKLDGGVSHIIAHSEGVGWRLWPHEAPRTPDEEAGWLASQIQNHRMDGHNIAGAEYAAKLVATTHEEE